MRRVQASELSLDKPLPWPIYDEYGNLLLRQGYVISIPRHLSSLLKRGAYVRVQPLPALTRPVDTRASTSSSASDYVFGTRIHASARPHSPAQPVFSRAETMAQTLKRLHAHVLAKSLQADLNSIVRSLANAMLEACSDDSDALLAALPLDRQSPYIVTQQLMGCALAEIAAREMGLDAPTRLSLACASLTRDLALLPLQAQLDVQTQSLDIHQDAFIKLHPLHSADILVQHAINDALWLKLVRQHHERLDGSGYPDALRADAIHPGAKILAIADSYAAMVTPRPNRAGIPPREALKAIYQQRSSLYDEELLRISVTTLTPMPPGTIVRLANGETAVVRTRQKKGMPADLWTLYDKSGMPVMTPQRRDSNDPTYAITGVLRVEDCRSALLVMKRLWTRA